MQLPTPMPNPCADCEKSALCASSNHYACPLFHAVFVQSWDETVAFLREVLQWP